MEGTFGGRGASRGSAVPAVCGVSTSLVGAGVPKVSKGLSKNWTDWSPWS